MKFIDWFAGVGGFRRGMELAGHECVGFCEFDKFAVMSYTSMHLITEEQRAYLATLPLKERQKEILKEEYRNGEWFASDVRRVYAGDIPRADCWCFGFPCQDLSVAGLQRGIIRGNRSSLFFRIMYLLGQLKEEERPKYLFIENVKNLISINGGWDFARVLAEMDAVGYDAEWQILNSKYFGVPQNRERCFIIGHLRGRSTAKVFPVEGTDGTDSIFRVINQIGKTKSDKRDNPQRGRIYDSEGLAPALNTMQGGNLEPHTIMTLNKEFNHEFERVLDQCGICGTLLARDYKDAKRVAIPVLTPDRGEKRQNGRRFKEDGEEAFTLTSQDRHGVAIDIDDLYTKREPRFYDEEVPTLRSDRYGLKAAVKVEPVETSCNQGIFVKISEDLTVYTVWYPKKQCYIAIRKLTPKECFRLQGWTDDYFERAQFVCSDSQLYKQAGNGVTVSVIKAIADKGRETREEW